MCYTYTEVLWISVEEDPFEKGSSSNSSPKTFNLNFAPMGCSQKRERLTLFVSGEYPIGAKFGLKVFGKRSGEEPFFRKVLPQ